MKLLTYPLPADLLSLQDSAFFILDRCDNRVLAVQREDEKNFVVYAYSGKGFTLKDGEWDIYPKYVSIAALIQDEERFDFTKLWENALQWAHQDNRLEQYKFKTK